MTAKEIENQPAFPVPETRYTGELVTYAERGPTFFQECVKANVAALVSEGERGFNTPDTMIVEYAINLATETCRQLAERSQQ